MYKYNVIVLKAYLKNMTKWHNQSIRTFGRPLSPTDFNRFYRAMHFSAKRGIAIACRLSVRLSVCL